MPNVFYFLDVRDCLVEVVTRARTVMIGGDSLEAERPGLLILPHVWFQNTSVDQGASQ